MTDRIIRFAETDSTNRRAAELFDELEDGTILCAERQTAGRGRLGRVWASPPGNLYLSFVMKQLPEGAFHATMASSLAVLEAVREFSPEADVFIKWPNDIFIREKKLCGILCEGVIREGSLKGIICGIGVNVNMTPEELEKVGQPAVSLRSETGREINLKIFTERLAIFLKRYYIMGIQSGKDLFRIWKKENRLLGKSVTFIPPSGIPENGLAEDVLESGELVIRRADGGKEIFSCGDVKIRV